MDAAALTCPQCGAAAGADDLQCSFCHARLATTACPSCFGLVFVGSKHCAHCGAAIGAVGPAVFAGRAREDGQIAQPMIARLTDAGWDVIAVRSQVA